MIHQDEVHPCDLHCGRPAPHTWICWDCHTQLVTALDAFTPDDLHHLQQIARREATPATRPTAHTTHQYGPNVPLHLGALVAHHAITTRFDGTLDGLPHDPDAAHHHHRHTNTLRYARELIDGEPQPFTPDEISRRVAEIPAMQTHVLVPWMRENCNVRLTAERVKKWAQAGHLAPARVVDGKRPYYHPADVLRVRAEVARVY